MLFLAVIAMITFGIDNDAKALIPTIETSDTSGIKAYKSLDELGDALAKEKMLPVTSAMVLEKSLSVVALYNGFRIYALLSLQLVESNSTLFVICDNNETYTDSIVGQAFNYHIRYDCDGIQGTHFAVMIKAEQGMKND